MVEPRAFLTVSTITTSNKHRAWCVLSTRKFRPSPVRGRCHVLASIYKHCIYLSSVFSAQPSPKRSLISPAAPNPRQAKRKKILKKNTAILGVHSLASSSPQTHTPRKYKHCVVFVSPSAMCLCSCDMALILKPLNASRCLDYPTSVALIRSPRGTHLVHLVVTYRYLKLTACVFVFLFHQRFMRTTKTNTTGDRKAARIYIYGLVSHLPSSFDRRRVNCRDATLSKMRFSLLDMYRMYAET